MRPLKKLIRSVRNEHGGFKLVRGFETYETAFFDTNSVVGKKYGAPN